MCFGLQSSTSCEFCGDFPAEFSHGLTVTFSRKGYWGLVDICVLTYSPCINSGKLSGQQFSQKAARVSSC